MTEQVEPLQLTIAVNLYLLPPQRILSGLTHCFGKSNYVNERHDIFIIAEVLCQHPLVAHSR